MFSAREILDLAIRLEENGEAVYRNAAGRVSDPDICALLVWMADEEVEHAKWFSGLKQELETRSGNPIMEEMSREIFGGLLGEKSFSHRDVDFSKVDNVEDLMNIFIEFEKDTVLFYETLIPFIEDDATLKIIEKIIAEENTHIKKLAEIDTAKKEVLVR